MSSWHSTGRHRAPPRRQVSIRLAGDELMEISMAQKAANELASIHGRGLWPYRGSLSEFVRAAALEKARALTGELETSHAAIAGKGHTAGPKTSHAASLASSRRKVTRSGGHPNVTPPARKRGGR